MVLNEIPAAHQIGFPILSALIFLPLAFVVVLGFMRSEHLSYRVGLVGAVIELVVACGLALRFNPNSDLQFVERAGSIGGVAYHLGVDGISVLFIPLTALLSVMVMIYAEYSVVGGARQYSMAVLGLEAAMMGAFAAVDLVLFWLFFVLELVPSYFLITRWGTGEHRRRAAREYIAFMLTGSTLMLAGIVVLGLNSQNRIGALSFSLPELLLVPVGADLQTLVFFLIFFGLAVKAPIFPFHTWMPKVLEEGPIVGISVFLVGIKLGTYGFIRFVIPLLPEASREWYWLMALLGVAGVVYGALIALVQTNLRRLVSFSSLTHMGVVLLGLFSLNAAGFEGGLLQMINLGIVGAGLFFVASFLQTRVGPPDLSALGGVVQEAPFLSATFLIIALAGIGLPGTNGFNGEHLVLIGTYQVSLPMAIGAGMGTLLTAAYFLWYFQRAFIRPADPHIVRAMPDLRPREALIVLVLGGMIFWIGLATSPFVRTMRPSLEALEERVGRGTGGVLGNPISGGGSP